MTQSTDFDLDLHEMVKAGFPARPELLTFLEVYEGESNICIEIEVSEHGEIGNGWDDPGSGCIWFVKEIHVPATLEHFFPVSDEQNQWIESHLDDRVQVWEASESWDDYDD